MKIPLRAPADRYPLSFAQHRLWFIDQLQPGNHAYNVGRAIRLRGALNRTAIDRAFSEIVRRHEILRTTYEAVDGVPTQRISDAAPVYTPVSEGPALQSPEDEHDLSRMIGAEIRRPFDLASDWPLRTLLLRLAPEDHVLVLTVHHIATDSMTIILGELSAFYEADVTGTAVGLPPLPIQYADYALWERDLLTGTYLERLTSYWRTQLEGAPHVLNLPTDLPRQPVLETHGTRLYFQMRHVPLEDLDALTRRVRGTQFSTWLAAFGVLLMRYSGQEDILVSGPIACRELPEIEHLVGCFANTIVFRLNLSGSPSFQETVGRVTRTVWGALAHRRLPFHHIVDIARPPRNASRVPLVQANFRVAAPDVLQLSGLDVMLLPVESSGSKFELAAQMSDRGDGFLDYNTGLFSPDRISAIAGDFESLMCALVARPDRPITSQDFRLPSNIRPSARPSLAGLAAARRVTERR